MDMGMLLVPPPIQTLGLRRAVKLTKRQVLWWMSGLKLSFYWQMMHLKPLLVLQGSCKVKKQMTSQFDETEQIPLCKLRNTRIVNVLIMSISISEPY